MTVSPAPLPHSRRPRWFAGQTLTADDLTTAQDVDTGLRQLHHRMLHGWGIASGLAVTAARGAVAVKVGAGYALDSPGRELVLPEPVTQPIPPVAGGPDGGPRAYVLVLRWTPDDEAEVIDRPGACGTEGAVRRSDAPRLSWRDPEAVATGYDIVLAEVAVQGCRLVAPPDLVTRRLLNPPPTPYIGAGHTAPGGTGWAVAPTLGTGRWGVRATVDTSEAGFGDTPDYLARLVGRRELAPGQSPDGFACLLDGTPWVEDPEPGRFRLVVPLVPGLTTSSGGSTILVNPRSVVESDDLVDLVSHVLQWSVQWIGVQS